MRHSLSLAILSLIGLLSTPLAAAEQVLTLDPTDTQIDFDLGATGHDVHGTFALRSGEIRFDPVSGSASGRLVVDASSAATGNGKRDRTMHEKVLESEEFPAFVFVPQRIDGQLATSGKSRFTVHGTLEIHGEHHPLDMVTTANFEGPRMHAEATFSIPFVAWGMHDPSFLFLRVEKEVQVSVSFDGELSQMVQQVPAGFSR